MCDCYEHKCYHLTCTQTVPMHIGDFAYAQEEFKVWCSTHIHEAEPGAVIFKMIPGKWGRKRWRCAIKGPEVGGDGDNHPNTGQEWTEVTV